MVRILTFATTTVLALSLFGSAPAEANCFDEANRWYQYRQSECRQLDSFPNCNRCVYGQDDWNGGPCNFSYETSTGNKYEYQCYRKFLNWRRNERNSCLRKVQAEYNNRWNRCEQLQRRRQ